jgi:hypothetical protein
VAVQGDLIKIPRLEEEQKILATFGAEHIHRLAHWKPVGRNETRAHAISLVAIDTGLGIADLQRVHDGLSLLAHG